MEQANNRSELLNWIWNSILALMRKYAYVRDKDIVITIGGDKYDAFYIIVSDKYNLARNPYLEGEDFYMCGVKVKFSNDFDNKTCSVGVKNWRQGKRMLIMDDGRVCFESNEEPETFVIGMNNLLR